MPAIQDTAAAANAKGTNERKYAFRCVLIADIGMMQSLWISSDGMGRYRFYEALKDRISQSPIMYIDGVKGKWVAHCLKGGQFYFNSSPAGDTVTLERSCILSAIIDGRNYFLFAEQETADSSIFQTYQLRTSGDITIGRVRECDICYPSVYVSKEHAMLRRNESGWTIVDQHSRNGIYLNNRKVISEEPVHVGDSIFIMGLRIMMGIGFITINDVNHTASVTSSKLVPVQSESELFPEQYPIYPSSIPFKRSPRRIYPRDTGTIEIEMPPVPLTDSQRIPLMLRMGSPVVMGARSMMTGNYAMMLTSMLFPILTNGYTEKARNEYEARRLSGYSNYLQKKAVEINEAVNAEERDLQSCYPTLPMVLDIPFGNSERLWERRSTDDDFLSLRLGYGELDMRTELKYEPQKYELDVDPMVKRMYELAERPHMLHSAPIMLSMLTHYLMGVIGDPQCRMSLIMSMIMQTAVFHSYDEVKIVILAEDKELRQLDFLRYMPHCWDSERTIRFIASEKGDAYRIGEYLKAQIEDDVNEKGPTLKKILRQRPYYVVFAFSRVLLDSIEVFKELYTLEENRGVSIVAAFDDGLPVECTMLIKAYEGNYCRCIDLLRKNVSDQMYHIDICNFQQVRKCVSELARKAEGHASAQFVLPSTLTFLEMFDVGRVEHLNPLNRWRENNPIISLAVPVGVGTDGKLFYLDLHEKRQGPHGLVAGMTGSGKSEFLITYILSMALNFSPDEVAFILIDYKGGGLTSSFEDEKRGIHLPHLVGTITNLDGAAIQRSLVSINSELKRRQAIFNQAKSETNSGTMDIYAYQKLVRSKQVKEPLPHLFIISDEFAELKKQQPEFMDELISTARIGRSLGVHLILATQKPAGVVNDQIWSNSKFRVCLRVQDKADSNDMLKRPEAAELKQTGRFYLQVGYNEYFALGQSAWSGADYFPEDEVRKVEDNSVQFLDMTGQTVHQVKPKVKRNASGLKQLVAVVQYLSDLAKSENIIPRQLWKEPLGNKLSLEKLRQQYPEQVGQKNISAMIGIVDDPERQDQFPLTIDVQGLRHLAVVGSSGSGKTTFLRSLLYALVQDYTPAQLNYYILDLSGGSLAPFKGVPYCGAYLTEADESYVGRYMMLINEMKRERKKLFGDAGVNDYDAYVTLAPLPLALFVIDNYSGVASFNRGAYSAEFHEMMRESASYGIKIIVSCGNMNEVSSRCRQEFGDRIGLHAKDRYEYLDILNIKCAFAPADIPGRGMCVWDGRTLEYHTAILGMELDPQEQTNYLRRLVRERSASFPDQQPEHTVLVLDPEEEYQSFCTGLPLARFPLGYSLIDSRKVSMPFKQLLSMSLYFGNPAGVAPVLENLLYAAGLNNMRVIIMQRAADSVFNQRSQHFVDVSNMENVELKACNQKNTILLAQNTLVEEITARNKLKHQFCDENGVSPNDEGLASAMFSYIYRQTRPLLVLFESFADFCLTAEGSEPIFSEVFKKSKGFNCYFAACFYPNDRSLAAETLFKDYNPDEFLLFFGGRLDKQNLTVLPPDLKQQSKASPHYNKFLMKYKGAFHALQMPCGVLVDAQGDPDDEEII